MAQDGYVRGFEEGEEDPLHSGEQKSKMLGGSRQYFGGLAVAPLTSLSSQLSHSSLSDQDVMKLRSIMRFSIEYHNPLVVHSENLVLSSPVKQFTDIASACFGVLHSIILALSVNPIDNGQLVSLCDDFRRMAEKLADLETLAKKQVERSTLEQSISAVHGQMKDFISMIDDSILPSVAGK